ncbi:diphthamide biosynthesis protein 2 [Hesseltinella vesiculosa]|uniref:2-(3-amino-3-carboxypropyl)histidine synthase subunit 2 n=1 Tax=Hesseltinella vesiculosa TaxID=101127 RepID=A0A1X2G6J0_9FUNG|nr:diphthamide biosynthesis protein 2 [Hesseltinella vesiculosa]
MAAEATGPVTMNDDGSSVMNREVIKINRHTNMTELQNLYELDRTVTYLLQNNFIKVALQFPDEMLSDADAVVSMLKDKVPNAEFFVLADTSYGSCCVDEVASQHVQAQVIIHYGHSCLSPTSHLPVLYIFGHLPIDVKRSVQKLTSMVPNQTQPIILMSNVEYSYAMDDMCNQLKRHYTQIIPTRIRQQDVHSLPLPSTCKDDLDDECCGGCGNSAKNRGSNVKHELSSVSNQQNGRHYELPDGVALNDCVIFFIGHDGPTMNNVMMVHNQCQAIIEILQDVYSFDPSTNQGRQETVAVNRRLMKRYTMVQKAKDAMTIGIVVGTLGVASYMNIIEHLKKVIVAARRKWYLFVMGKLNVAKMANFMEIDCYVLVACPENSLIDSKEFYRPIVTPYELELALMKSAEWTGNYVLDFSKLLPHLRSGDFQYDEEKDDGSSDDEGHFSLITGQYVSNPFQKVRHTSEDAMALTSQLSGLTLRNQETTITQLLNSTAGDYLQKRSYQGLDPKIGEDEASVVEEGRSGIARGYTQEKDE